MSDSTDSEEFYDAEDSTPKKFVSKKQEFNETSRKNSSIENKETNNEISSKLDSSEDVKILRDENNEELKKPEEMKLLVNDDRKWFSELRQRMQTDDEDIGGLNTSQPESQTSSVEGVFAQPAPKTSHPFRIIEHDNISIQSMMSLGRVGRLLGGIESGLISNQSSLETTRDSSPVSLRSSQSTIFSQNCEITNSNSVKSHEDLRSSSCELPLQEPDVIASTKNSITTNNLTSINETKSFKDMKKENTEISDVMKMPVPPPRKWKKKSKTFLHPSVGNNLPDSLHNSKGTIPLPSPASTIESLTRELENSLDIHSATKGQYVVKPQDEDKAKAEEVVDDDRPKEIKNKDKFPITNNLPLMIPCNTNSIGRTSINSASGLSMSHFVGLHSNATMLDKNSEIKNSEHKKNNLSPKVSKERRKSADDEQGFISQLNMFVRTRTDSGKQLSDLEILEQVTVLNLDTGERVPLSVAEDKLPQGINPLSLHIMRLTSEYVSDTNLEKQKESDEESVDSKVSEIQIGKDFDRRTVKKKTEKLKKFFGSTVKKTMDKAKLLAQEVSQGRHKEEGMDITEEGNTGEQYIKLKASNSHKGPYDFDSLKHVQDLSGEHQGPVWCMKFSACGRLLATAGQDKILRVWVLKNAYQQFQDIRTKYNNPNKVSPTPSQESLVSQHSGEDPESTSAFLDTGGSIAPFMPKPLCTYVGHTSDLLDVSWSKNYFVLSSSMDKTVRLWHISRKECLCCFQHIDFVTAIVFLPRDDRYFLSGSLDGKLRLWNIPDKKVAVWNEVDGQTKLITAANFCLNGKLAVIGSYDGRCIFYHTDNLKYHTTIHVRSTRGKNSTGRKISGIEPMPGEEGKILVTSNDSRIRLYDLRDLNLSCKYKGYVNISSQIKASFSHDGKYIISGSENQCLYIWKTHHDYAKFSSVRRDRNDFWEGIKVHNAVVTCAVFAPNPESIIKELEEKELELRGDRDEINVEDPVVAQRTKGCGGYVLVSADFNGCIKVFVNKMKPKHSSLPASALA
ncbi:WD repeat domain-containing protein, putative [Pediculus humanus corporis]|uniref:WD repeat-containing protein 44 n=1 Tax=Pediculus humanus subsp. corporis TaxID=121224 RepID=E0VKN1_PEDHC|nr:WD repeat domain-containing protein, putative [Pediculus humanus corporis]EEB13937.1 WD repeat domain-containing protein, putative [Pediculus humanus corporis]